MSGLPVPLPPPGSVTLATRDAAWDAAGAALAPTVATLQASALQLLEAMIDPALALAAMGAPPPPGPWQAGRGVSNTASP